MLLSIWRNSFLARFLGRLHEYARKSAVYGWLTNYGNLADGGFYEDDAAICLLAGKILHRFKASLQDILNRVAGVYRKSLLYGLSLIKPGFLEGSWVYRRLRYFQVEDLVYILLLFVFWDYFLRQYAATALLWKVWDKALFIVIVFAWVARQTYRGEAVLRRNSLNLPVFSVIAVMIFLFLINSPITQIGLDGLRVYVEYMLWFFVGANLISDQKQLKNVIRVMIAASFLVSLYGIYQYHIKVPIPPQWLDRAEPSITTRVFSIVESPNVLGSLMTLTIPLALGEFLYCRRRWQQPVFLIMLLSMTACLIFTFTRAAWISLAGGIVLFAVLYNWRMLAGLVAAGFAVPFAVPGVMSRMLYLVSPAYMASSERAGRLERWSRALQQVNLHPLVGDGLGWFGGAVAVNEVPGSFYVDSFYVKTLAETGLIGTLAFLWLVVSIVRCGIANVVHMKSPYLKLAGTAILAGLFGVLLHNTVENIFEVPMMSTYFWFFTGVLAGLPLLDKENVL